MPVLKPTITVIKRNLAGRVMVQYSALVLRRESDYILLEARFTRPDTPILDAILKNNDRFVEIYYTGRWYNIFEVHAREDDRIKGWYCNVGHPAVFESDDRLSYVDLALDLWVAPDRSQTVMDEDEFAALDLDAETRRQARAALEELQKLFAENKNPDFS
jgi:predicted RNA-binding protein associated with RNAse of E/G family